MKTQNIKDLLIHENSTLLDAMRLIDKNCKGILIVISKYNKLLGTITDGDIRRAILQEKPLKSPIELLFNNNCIYVLEETDEQIVKSLFIKNKIKFIPVVNNDKNVVGYYEIDDFIDYNRIEKDNPVLIMAGGLGSRLKPLTDEIPKPMLRVGNKPILETIIDQFRDNGFKEILLSVNYKAEIIENYFQDGKKFGVSIKYIKEPIRLGTAGAIRIAQKYLNKTFIVINGDILTNVNMSDLLNFHKENMNSMTIGTRMYDMQVPYGVLDVNNSIVSSLQEKPIYNFVVSGGIYVIDPEAIKFIPENEYFDITELINKMLNNKQKVVSFPIKDYWMDIGKIEDYYKANKDINKNNE